MSKFLTEEFRELVAYLGDIFWNIVGLYVGRAWNEKHLLVVSPGCFAEALLRHIKSVGVAPGNHKKGLIDKIHFLGGVPVHEVDKAAFCVAES